jgi:NADPH:quinone reductase-like Zn-dependent oxidoreductase
MKALVAARYGGPEVLAITERPEPEVGPRDVLIAVKAASLNPLDSKIRDGKVKLVLRLHPPIALDAAGTSVDQHALPGDQPGRLAQRLQEPVATVTS